MDRITIPELIINQPSFISYIHLYPRMLIAKSICYNQPIIFSPSIAFNNLMFFLVKNYNHQPTNKVLMKYKLP